MNDLGARFAEMAEQFVGAPYRLHGRDPEKGLDCVGLALAALMRCGRPIADRSGYSLRVCDTEELFALAEKCGFESVPGTIQSGDVLLVKPGPAQAHVLIAGHSNRFIHAHAGIGRVVSQRTLPDWPILAHWRLSPEPE